MPISKELQRVRGETTLPDELRRAVELRRELERQGIVRPPEPATVRQGPADPDHKIKILYR